MDGQTALTNGSKFLPVIRGDSYRACTAAEYHSRETKLHECKVGCEESFVRDRMEKTWTSISGGKPSERRLTAPLEASVPGSSMFVLQVFMIPILERFFLSTILYTGM